MHPRIAELLRFLDEQTATLRAAYDAVPVDQRGVRPALDRWSPVEVVHHVTIVERRVTGRIRALVEQARAIGRDADESSVLAAVGADRMLSRVRRITTGEATEPRDANAATLWTDFDDARRTLTEVVASGDGLALGAVSAPHPALGELTGYGWIAFIGAHAGRHAAQIREDAQ
jgi:hypothetical protein